MHFTLIVTGDDYKKQLAPFQERWDDETESHSGFWDWYQLGGRWRGFFPLKPGAVGVIGEPGAGDNEATPGGADSAIKRDIDFSACNYVPYAFLHNGQWISQEVWTGHDWVKHTDWETFAKQFISALPDNTRLSLIDYHS